MASIYGNNAFTAVGAGLAVRSGIPGDTTPKPSWVHPGPLDLEGRFRLQVETIRRREVSIESSLDLRSWTGLLQTNVPAGVTELSLAPVPGERQLFRARSTDSSDFE